MDITTLRSACLAAASADTAYDPIAWEQHKDVCPLSEHCFVTAFVVQHFFGGLIICGLVKGERHAWNRLPSGEEIDLSGSQYGGDGYHPVGRGRPWRHKSLVNPRFHLFLERVREQISYLNGK